MATFIRTYSSESEARRAVAALRATEASQGDIRLLTGGRLRDVRRERVGTFAGSIGPDAPVGTFGGKAVLRRQARGSFAGDPDRQRQGSFGDTDRVVIVSYSSGRERIRTTGLRGARRLLARASIDDASVQRAVGALHSGHAVVLVEVAGDVTEVQASDRYAA
jgi:hypothetical protein